MIIGGIDPGLVALGWAASADPYQHSITRAGIVRGAKDLPYSERIVDIADRLRDVMPLCDVIYVECMRYRPGAKVNPAILLQLNLLAGSCMRLLKPSGQMFFVEPTTWKGTLDKEVHHSRIRVCLDEQERAIVDAIKPKSLAHNATDAVGLCLFATGRLTPQTKTLRKK